MNTTQAPRHKLYTQRDLQEMDRRGYRFELIEGDLEPMSPTSISHGDLSHTFSLFVGLFVREHQLGLCTAAETGFVISRDPDTVLAPDFAFVSSPKLANMNRAGYGDVVPDLVLETRSPSDTPAKVARKIRLWLDAGVGMAVDLDPERRLLIVHCGGREPLTLNPTGVFRGEDVLPGFEMPLHNLFRDPAP